MFVDMQRFAEEDLSNQSVNSLKKGIRSLKKVIALHEDKILNPVFFYPDRWPTLSKVEKLGVIKHWQKEIKTAKQSILNRTEELKKRGEDFDEVDC